MSTPLLTTKLYIPPVRPELVSRPRLIERLNAGLHRKLTLVSAPAGVWIWRRAAWGYALSGVMLVQAVTLGLSISVGQIIALAKGLEGDMFLAGFFLVFTLVGMAAAVLYLKNSRSPNR